ncbi:MAG: hypothetical protein P8100_14780, partial [bacterium]
MPGGRPVARKIINNTVQATRKVVELGFIPDIIVPVPVFFTYSCANTTTIGTKIGARSAHLAIADQTKILITGVKLMMPIIGT